MIYDAVLCVAPKHINIAITAVCSLADNAKARNIYVITAANNFPHFRNLERKGIPLIIIDENTLIPRVDLQSIQNYLRLKDADPQRAGWYLQQFLKMGISYLPAVADYYLVWDSDTILLRSIRFFTDDDKVIINPALEYHPPYFDTYYNILGKRRSADFSFISEYMMIKKDYMRELIDAVNDHTSVDQVWVWNIMNAIDLPHLSGSGFSEYETYGNFIMSVHKDSFICRQISSLRSASNRLGMCPNKYDLSRLSRKYVYATFEVWSHGKPMRVIREKIISYFLHWLHAIKD
jgi:hypothetical protein